MNCVVYGCPNNNFSNPDPAVQYFAFPKHPTIAQQWVNACGWQDIHLDLEIARICSVHFDENCYTTQIQMIDFNACCTKMLKYDAVPTLYLPQSTQIVIKQGEGSHDELNEMIVFEVPANDSHLTDQTKEYIELHVQPIKHEDTVVGDDVVDMSKYQHVKTEEQLAMLEDQNKTLHDSIIKAEEKMKQLQCTLDKQMRIYRDKDLELSNLRNQYFLKKRACLSLQEQKSLLSKVFSESQIKILSGKKKIYWSNDDMAVGYTIRHLSNKRCYMYLTKKLQIPLPAVSSIKRWMTLKNSRTKKQLNIDAKKNEDSGDDSD